MEFKKNILPNGLSIIGEVNKFAKSAAVGFFVRTGSRDESKEVNGVSHFLEHMLFKGTNRLNCFEVNEAFGRTGAQFNAFTSEENTVYYAAVLPEYLFEVTNLWIELMRPALRDEDFNIEKNVIKEEIAMYKDLPGHDILERCRKLYFGDGPCGNSVLGSDESINDLTAEQMRGYFAGRYAPNNMVFACAGNFEWGKICSTVEQGCTKWEKQPADRKLEDYAGQVAGNMRKERIEKANLSREHICLISPAVSAQDKRRFAAAILATIVGDDVGSRFFWELVDKAIAETASMQFSPMDGTGAFYSYISCGGQNVPTVLDAIKNIFEDLCRNGVTEEEMRTAKNKILSALVIKNELPMGRLVDLGFNWVYLQQYRTIEDDINAIKGVTIDEVCSLAKELKPGEFTQLSMGPAK